MNEDNSNNFNIFVKEVQCTFLKNEIMKAWKFKLKSSPKEISEKLESELQTIGGFVFDKHLEGNKSIGFKFRKRILYAWYMAFQNWTIVKGQLSNKEGENETQVEINFNQHFFIRLILLTHIVFAAGVILAILSGINTNTAMYILGAVVLGLGLILWFTLQQKFEKDIQKYKVLISDIFEL